jgi:hypothetical protein
MIYTKLEHLQLSFCVDIEEVGVQVIKQDQEIYQWILCTLKNKKKTKLWNNNLLEAQAT